MQEKGIYLDRQFVDAPVGLTKKEYIRWLKDSKKTFFYTIPAESLLLGQHINRLRLRHSKEELQEPCLDGYSPNKIIKTLELLDIYTIMLLLTDYVKLETIGYCSCYWHRNCFVTGIYNAGSVDERKIAARTYFDSSSVASVIDGKNPLLREDYMNLREFLFRNLELPIGVILNSINEAINPHLLPNEGLGKVIVAPELCEKIYQIRRSNEYKSLAGKE